MATAHKDLKHDEILTVSPPHRLSVTSVLSSWRELTAAVHVILEHAEMLNSSCLSGKHQIVVARVA